MEGRLPERRHPAHPHPLERHDAPTVLFVTVRTRVAEFALTTQRVHEGLLQAWTTADHWHVGPYLIMPDHVHLFCVPGVVNPLGVKAWCKYWKGQLRRILGMPGTVWQRDCWDTQMRHRAHYEEKLLYVQMNPVRKGLVTQPQDWSWQGQLTEIRW
jgi:putative transposase